MSFIVSDEGRVIEPMIEDSSGNEQLEGAALDGVRKWTYEPATLNGVPVEQSMTQMMIRFVLEDVDGVSPVYRSRYREIEQTLLAGELGKAETLLTDLDNSERVTLYEDAWLWWLKYRYLVAAGATDRTGMAESLRNALVYQEPEPYLSPDVFVAAAERLFLLEMQELDFPAAIDVFERLRDSEHAQESDHYAQSIANLEPIYKSILDTVAADTILEFQARIGEYGYWVHKMLRRSFTLADVQGSIELLDSMFARQQTVRVHTERCRMDDSRELGRLRHVRQRRERHDISLLRASPRGRKRGTIASSGL